MHIYTLIYQYCFLTKSSHHYFITGKQTCLIWKKIVLMFNFTISVFISFCFYPLWVERRPDDGFRCFFLCGFHRQDFNPLGQMSKSSRTGCFYIAESMCMSDCTHSIVSRCVRSPLQPFHFCLFSSPCAFISRWPPPLHPALVLVLLSYTSWVSSALYWHETERLPVALPSVTSTKRVVFVPFAQTTPGRLEIWRVFCRPRLHCKNWNFFEMKIMKPSQTPCKLLCLTFVCHLLAGVFSPPSPSFTVYPVFPRGPCVPPRPQIRHTHKYTHMVLITQTNESGEWGIRWKQNTVGHPCQ